jgi:hypothetical protein
MVFHCPFTKTFCILLVVTTLVVRTDPVALTGVIEGAESIRIAIEGTVAVAVTLSAERALPAPTVGD